MRIDLNSEKSDIRLKNSCSTMKYCLEKVNIHYKLAHKLSRNLLLFIKIKKILCS